jgi:hypothetical protein
MALKQERLLFQDGFDIGIGVALATGSPMALGASGELTPPQIGTGGSGTFTFRRIESTEDLSTELGIGADVTAGIGLFSGSASFDFSKKCRIQSSSLSVLVSAEESFAFQQMDSPRLSDAASAFVEAGNLSRFGEQFGDYFVRGISTGGRFFGLVRIDTKSTQSKTDVDAALNGSYGLTMSAEVRLKISEAMSRANAKAEAFIIFDGGHIVTRPTSRDPVQLIDQLYKAMDEWTATVRTEPKAYSVTLTPYAIALGPPPPNIAQLEHQRDVLIRCAKLRLRTLDKLNLVEYILDPSHIAEFEIAQPPEGPNLPALQASLASDLDVIAEAAAFAINNLKEARSPEEFMRDIKQVGDFAFTVMPRLPQHSGGSIATSAPAPAPAPATIPVRSFVGILFDEFESARQFMANTTDRTLAGLRAVSRGGASPSNADFGFTDATLSFLVSGVLFQFEPTPPDLFDTFQGRMKISAQFPASGTVAPGEVVILQVVPD